MSGSAELPLFVPAWKRFGQHSNTTGTTSSTAQQQSVEVPARGPTLPPSPFSSDAPSTNFASGAQRKPVPSHRAVGGASQRLSSGGTRALSLDAAGHANKANGFASEFPSLRDAAGAAGTPGVSDTGPSTPGRGGEASAQYRPSFLAAERVGSNWTSKLADAPVLPTRVSEQSPYGTTTPSSPPPPTLARNASTASARDAPSVASVSNPVPGGGWGQPGAAGEARPRLVDALTGTGQQGAGQGPAPLNDSEIRAQLALRQSKQLIPLVGRKAAALESNAVSGASTTVGGMVTLGTKVGVPGRSALVSGNTAVEKAVGGSGKLVLKLGGASRPASNAGGTGGVGHAGMVSLGPATTTAAATNGPTDSDAAASLPAAQLPRSSTGGMVALRRSPPPPPSRRLTGSPPLVTPASPTPQRQHRSTVEVLSSPVLAQQAPNGAGSLLLSPVPPPPACPSSPSPATAPVPATDTPATPPAQPEGAAAQLPGPAPAETSAPAPLQAESPAVDDHANVEVASGGEVSTSPGCSPAARLRSTGGSSALVCAGGGGSPCSSSAWGVPAEEVAFLRSLGWTDSESEQEDGEGLTDAEIAAFRAAAATGGGASSSRCATPQLLTVDPFVSRTGSPAPGAGPGAGVAGAAAPGAEPLVSPLRGAQHYTAGPRWLDEPAGSLADAAAALVTVEPLFPGVSKGWFGGITLPLAVTDPARVKLAPAGRPPVQPRPPA